MIILRMRILILIKNMRMYIKQKGTLLCHLLKFNVKVDVVGQYANRCEMCIIFVKTMPHSFKPFD